MNENQSPATLRTLYAGGLGVAQGVCGIITTPDFATLIWPLSMA